MSRFRIERLNADESTDYEYFSDRMAALEVAETLVMHGRNQYVSVWTKNYDGTWLCDAEVQNFDGVVETMLSCPTYRSLLHLDEFGTQWDAVASPVMPLIRAYFDGDYANYHIEPRDEIMVFDEYDPVFKHPQFRFVEKRTTYDLEDLIGEYEAYGSVVLECGCRIEGDNVCRHGNESPLAELGF